MPAAIVAGERISACLNSPEGTAMTSGNRTSLRIAAAAMASEVPAAGRWPRRHLPAPAWAPPWRGLAVTVTATG